MNCQSCQADLSDYWLPTECWWNKGKSTKEYDSIRPSLRSPRRLEIGDLISASINDCVSCGGPHVSTGHELHSNSPMGDYLEYSPQLGRTFFVLANEDVAIPIDDFYKVEPHDGSERIPIDCRGCDFYQTHKCIPLRNAIDEVISATEFSYSGDVVDDIVREVYSMKIMPCANYKLNPQIRFKNWDSFDDWLDMMKSYCGFDEEHFDNSVYAQVYPKGSEEAKNEFFIRQRDPEIKSVDLV